MSTIIEAPEKKEFVPHPAGTFIAVMRDCFLQDRPNPWRGTTNDKGQVDNRENIRELVLEFLTDHEVELEGGKKAPGYVRYKATASLAENANLRKFLQGWFPALKEEDFKRFDADKLIGRGAYITVSHNTDKKGNVWANVKGAMQPPKGSQLPPIPPDFVRHKDRPGATQVVASSQQVAPAEEEDDLPF